MERLTTGSRSGPGHTQAMKSILPAASRTLHLALLATVLAGGAFLTSCTTTDAPTDTTDTMIYPTPAEKNHQMQEKMSQMTRTLM